MGMGLRLPKSEGSRGRRQARTGEAAAAAGPKKSGLTSTAWKEAKALIWARRGRLALGLAPDADQSRGRAGPAGDVEMADR